MRPRRPYLSSVFAAQACLRTIERAYALMARCGVMDVA